MTVDPRLDKPRFRNDLVAQPIEEDAYRWVDVTDPNSGATFRFYDVEYTIACAMDGARDLSALADWTRVELGIETSAEELTTLVGTLADLGYLEGPGLGSDDPTAVRPIPTGANGSDAGWTDETAQEVSAAYDQVMELGPAGKSETATTTRVPKVDAPAIDLGPPGVGDAAEAVPTPAIDTSGVELAEPSMRLKTEADMSETERALADAMAGETPPPKTMKEEEMSFAGLLDDVEPTKMQLPKPPGGPSEVPPARRADSRAETQSRPGSALGDDEPTNLPGAMPDDGEEDVSVDLSAHISLNKKEVQEAVRSSKVISIPELPPDVKLEEDVEEITTVAHDEVTTEKGTAVRPRPETRPPPPPPGRVEPAKPEMRAAAPAVTLPDRPPPRSGKAVEPISAPQKKSSAGKIVIGITFLAAVAVVLYLFKDDILATKSDPTTPTRGVTPPPTQPANPDEPPVKPNTPPDEPTPVAAKPDAAPEVVEVVPDAPAALPIAAVKEETAPAEATVASPSDGVVAWTADDGAEVEAGAVVAKLQGYQKWETKRQKDGVDRLTFYEGELAKATTPAAQAAMQKKVDEKKGIVAEADAALAPFYAKAPAGGRVKIVAAKFARVKAGDPVVSIGGAGAGTGTVLRATFDAGEAASKYKPGPAVLAAKDARDQEFAGVVEAVEGTMVTVRLVTGAPAKAGDEIVLLPPK
jgi:hypothetical protein